MSGIILVELNLEPILFLAALCICNCLLLLYDRYVSIPIDLELSTFSAVLLSFKFGIMWGIAGGILTKLATMLNNSDFSSNSLISLSCYTIAAIVGSILCGMTTNFLLIGLIASLVSNLASYFLCRASGMADIEIAMYGLSNLAFNWLIFGTFSFYAVSII